MTNAEALKDTSTTGLLAMLADACELRTEILGELRERNVAVLPVTPQLRAEIHEQHLEDLGMDV
jgi:hypothetical protein